MKSFNKLAKENYGIGILILAELCFLLIVLFFRDNIYIAINDNLDSSIPLFKIFRDNHFWKDRITQVPICGGIDRTILTSGYSLNHIIYYLFDTKIAYWVNYIVALALSGTGFYFLGNSIKKQTKKPLDSNIFCICGIFYIFLGMWPIAIISFALIPWWAFLVFEIYRTKKIWLTIFFVPLLLNLSAVLFGVFLLFYTVIFGVIVSVKEKKINKTLLLLVGIIIIIFIFFNYKLLLKMFFGTKETIKSLAMVEGHVYRHGIKLCFQRFLKFFFIDSTTVYHAGLFPLKYIAFPLVFSFFILAVLEYKRLDLERNLPAIILLAGAVAFNAYIKNHSFSINTSPLSYIIFPLIFSFYVLSILKHKQFNFEKELGVFFLLIGAIAFNALAIAFDHCAKIRKLIPFLSGFNFERFIWLSPFFIILCFIFLINFLIEKHYYIISIFLLIALPISILIDVDYTDTGSMYNFTTVNYKKYICHEKMGLHTKWDDYFAPDLFSKIKDDINYNNEWCVAFAFEPAILQYNDIKTLDGYYSNYSTDLKLKWEDMISPALEANKDAKKYWNQSYGIRCYLYAKEWLFPDYSRNYQKMGGVALLIKPDILRELGGKYIFSRVVIRNYKELGLEFKGYWNDNRGIYDIGVYKIQ